MKRDIPPSARITAEIRARITSGELRGGDRVPSTREITRVWGVAIATATKVLGTLRQEGLVRAVPGVGTIVATPAGAPRGREVRELEGELTRERVVQAGIGIADSEGLAALSMRRIAGDLAVATMSLYRHVPGKDELVLLMANAVMGEIGLPQQPPPGWRAQLELLARLHWAGYRRHPWLAQAISMTRPQMLPNGVAQTEWALRSVAGLGLDENAMLHVAVTLIGFVRGTATSLEPEAQAQEDSGITDDEWIEGQDTAMEELLGTGRYPTLAGVLARPGLDLSLDTVFEFGLQQLLDGLAARIQR